MYYLLGYLGVGVLIWIPLIYLEIRGRCYNNDNSLTRCWYLSVPLSVALWPVGLVISLQPPNNWTEAWRACQQRKTAKLQQLDADYHETLLLIEYDKYGRYGKELERSLDARQQSRPDLGS